MATIAPLIISFYGIGAALSWGSADYLAARASKRKTPNVAILGVSAIGTLLFTIIFLFNHGTIGWNVAGILYSIAAGISLELGLLVFYRALDAGPVSLVSPISSAYPLVSLLIILIIFGGSLKVKDTAGIVIVVVGIAITSGLLNVKKSERKLSRGVIYALLTVFIWGIAYALIGKSVADLGWQKATLVNFYAGLAVLPITLTLITGKRFWSDITTTLFADKYIIGAAIAQALGGVLFNIGVSHTNSSAVITAISATYPALTIVLALKGLQEKAKVTSLMGALITVIGVVVLSL